MVDPDTESLLPVALVAVRHSILTAIWHMLTTGSDYQDRGAGHYLNRLDPARQARRLVNQLHQLGYETVVTPTQ
jgi:hypothetical protein